MFIIIVFIVAIILQFYAAIVAISLIKKTKYNVTWILVSTALILMAVRRVIELIPHFEHDILPKTITVSNFIGVIISIVIAIGFMYIKKIFTFLKRIEELRLKSENRILSAIIKTEEKERRRFAKDLHDGLGPLLSSVKMSVSALSQTVRDDNNKKIISNIELVVNESIGAIKDISNNLSPHILDNFGLLSAVKSFSDKINISKSINIVVNSNIDNERFDYNAEVILYRVICELISNTIKHASAKTINIDIYLEKEMLHIYYYDDGIGFNVDKVLNSEIQGMGFSNILSRIKSINGVLEIESLKNDGVHVNIKVKV